MAHRRVTKLMRVGIDFGTTETAVAYGFHRTLEHEPTKFDIGEFSISRVHTVRFARGDQVKSQIAWRPDKNCYVWGDDLEYSIEDGYIAECDRISMPKLGLCRSTETQAVRRTLDCQLRRLPPAEFGGRERQPTVQDLITIYLRLLWDLVCEKISNHCTLDGVAVECVICVPALWDPDMNHAMITAAEDAGIPNPTLTSEPEAAAAFIVQEQFDETASGLGLSLKSLPIELTGPFLFADVGGGTGDFITYIIESVHPFLAMKEGICGTGSCCGSAFLNLAFREFFEFKYRNDIPTFLEDRKEQNTEQARDRLVDIAVKDFEKKKKKFDGYSRDSKEPNMRIRIDGIKASEHSRQDMILIDREHIISIFSKIIKVITHSICQQIGSFNEIHKSDEVEANRRIKRIFFVGGLSGSPHVLNTLRDQFHTGPSPLMGYPIEISTPKANPAIIVAKGAVLKSFQKDPFRERILRWSYGAAWQEEYDRKKHHKAKVLIDPHDGRDIVEDRAKWLVKAGEIIGPGKFVRGMKGWRCLPKNGPITLEEKLYVSKCETRDSVGVHNNKQIKPIGILKVDLSDSIDQRLLPEISNSRTKQSHHCVDYVLRITIEYPRLFLEIIIPKNGKWATDLDYEVKNNIDPCQGPGFLKQTANLSCVAAFDVGVQHADKTMTINDTIHPPGHRHSTRQSNSPPRLARPQISLHSPAILGRRMPRKRPRIIDQTYAKSPARSGCGILQKRARLMDWTDENGSSKDVGFDKTA